MTRGPSSDPAGVVHLRGLVNVGDSGEPCTFSFGESHIFSLPPGYEPEHDQGDRNRLQQRTGSDQRPE